MASAEGAKHETSGGRSPDIRRPRVVISRCIDFDSCRYNGQVIRAGVREELEQHVDLVPICPELEIGLGVPRDPVRLVRAEGGPRMVQPATARDLTAPMTSFARDFLAGVGPVDGFVLKSRSPSCAVRDAPVLHRDTDHSPLDAGPGLFAAQVLEAYPDAAVEDELTLRDPRRRREFVATVEALAQRRSLREVPGSPP
jgi:uncharacterized protein YbbK (DUF523 family)